VSPISQSSRLAVRGVMTEAGFMPCMFARLGSSTPAQCRWSRRSPVTARAATVRFRRCASLSVSRSPRAVTPMRRIRLLSPRLDHGGCGKDPYASQGGQRPPQSGPEMSGVKLVQADPHSAEEAHQRGYVQPPEVLVHGWISLVFRLGRRPPLPPFVARRGIGTSARHFGRNRHIGRPLLIQHRCAAHANPRRDGHAGRCRGAPRGRRDWRSPPCSLEAVSLALASGSAAPEL
jgi:hypothetical protein